MLMHLHRTLALAFASATATLGLPAAELMLHAAASLSDAMEELVPLYERAAPDTLKCNYGASGTLARQIKEGAPGDLFFSADALRMDQLDEGGLLLADTRRTIVSNTLVLIMSADDDRMISSLAQLAASPVRRIAIGEPATVPAGSYAMDHLRKIGLWDDVAERLVPLDNVRAVLAAVGSGNAGAGFVYRTDARVSKNVRIALEIPATEGPAIAYPIAVLHSSRSVGSARAFITFLVSPEAQAVFAKLGFLPPN